MVGKKKRKKLPEIIQSTNPGMQINTLIPFPYTQTILPLYPKPKSPNRQTNPSPFMSSSVKIISIIVAISESLNIFFWIGLSASASVNMVVAKGGNY